MIKIVQQCETSSAEAFSASSLMRRMERMERRSLMRQRRMNEYSEGLWAFVHNRPRSNGRQEKTRRATFSSECSARKRTTWENFSDHDQQFFFFFSLLLKKYSIKETNPTIITVYTAILSACLGEYKCGDQTLVESEKKKKKKLQKGTVSAIEERCFKAVRVVQKGVLKDYDLLIVTEKETKKKVNNKFIPLMPPRI